jgi:hypothetical protein
VINHIPEPTSLSLIGLSAAGMLIVRQHKRRSRL